MTRTIFLLMTRLAAAYAWSIVALLAFGIVSGIESGPLAIIQILTPHLALAAIPLVPLVALRSVGGLRLGLVVLLVLFGGRFGGEWFSTAATAAGGGELRVATWNLEVGARAGIDSVVFLREHPADLVALQELTPSVAAAIEEDPVLVERYPYRALEVHAGVAGMGLMSRLPLTATPAAINPARQEARLTLAAGEIVVVNAHPFPADAGFFADVLAFDPSVRNRYLQLLRDRVADLEAAGEVVLLIGDFNTGPTEPAFKRLTTGLCDAHAEVGLGPGWTWRPGRLAFLGTGLLRIDLVLTTAGLRPITISAACPSKGDHCLVEALLALER